MLKVFNGHILNFDNIVEVKWHAETGELVYLSVEGEWCGVAGTRDAYNHLLQEISEGK